MFIRTLALAAIVVTALLAAASSASASPSCETQGAAGVAYEVGVNCRTVALDGVDREYLVYVPRQRPLTGERAPVVLMFHGSSGTGEQFLRTSGWREQADRTGLVAVFPTGLRYRVLDSGLRVTKWNDFSLAGEIDLEELPPGYPEDSPMPADDVGFVDLIMADLDARLPIDRRRVYASGFSNGAAFAARLSVDRSTRIASAAYSGGGMTDVRSPARPVPSYVTAGTLDDRALEGSGLTELPLDPVEILASPVVRPFIDLHLATLGLDAGRFGAVTRPDTTSLRWPAVGSGPDGAVLRFGMLGAMGHTWPDQLVPDFWEFLRSHPLP
jgi:polyhydroxybutyrate depolymerase